MPTGRHFIVVSLWVVVVAAFLLAGDERAVRGIARPPAELVALRGIESEQVTAVRIARGGESLRLERSGEVWSAPGFHGVAARSERVERLLELVKEIDGAEESGGSVASHATFEVTDEGFVITLEGSGDGLPATLRVGSPNEFERCHVRFGDGVKVYSVTPNLRFDLELGTRLEPEDWLDMLLTDLPEEVDIPAATFRTESGTIVLKRLQKQVLDTQGAVAAAAVWQVTEPEAFLADTMIVEGFLRNVKKVHAIAVADPARLPESGIVDPLRTVAVTLASGETIAIDVGNDATLPDGRSGIYARRRGEDTLYILPSWTRSNLFKTLDQLRRGERE